MKAATMLLLTTSARALRPAARRLRYRRFHYQSGGKSSAGTAAAAVGCFAASAAYALGDEAEDGAWAGVLDTKTTGAAALKQRVPEGDGRGTPLCRSLFPTLALGCISTNFYDQILIFQHFSRSTRSIVPGDVQYCQRPATLY